MFHPQLMPATIGAIAGFALIVWASIELFSRWNKLAPRTRWIAFTAIAAFELVYWINIYAWFVEPNLLTVRRIEIASEDWRGPPLTMAVVSDTHVGGPHVDAARVGRIVQRVNALRPEIVFLLGDYVNGHLTDAARTPADNQEIMGGVATFAALNARYGVVSVIGNHDVWYNRSAVTRALEEAGVAALWDRNVVIDRSGGDVLVVGLADDVTSNPIYADAVDGAPEELDTIVLSHTPDVFPEVPAGPALLLAGHTHCGQVTIPLLGRTELPIWNKQYGCHRVDEAGRTIYVTGGLGTSSWPVRFLNPPEIVLIHMRGTSVAHGAATGEG